MAPKLNSSLNPMVDNGSGSTPHEEENNNNVIKTRETNGSAVRKTSFNADYKDLNRIERMMKRKPIKFIRSDPYTFVQEGFFDPVPINSLAFFFGHIIFVYSIYVTWSYAFKVESMRTNAWSLFMLVWAGLGIGAGAHRLWTHRSYKASLPLQVFLGIGQCIAGQNCIYIWSRDHRVHHKFSDTDADPHNINRGVFFAHVGWLLKKRHPDVLTMGAKLDFDDLKKDPLVAFQNKYYYYIYGIFAFGIPVLIPVLVWNECIIRSLLVCFVFRQGVTLHCTWFVNSAAHLMGDKPYDPNINPVENSMVSIFTLGEGYHNFHHAFPYDYRAADIGVFNSSRVFIEKMHEWGLANDLKVASKTVIEGKQMRHNLM